MFYAPIFFLIRLENLRRNLRKITGKTCVFSPGMLFEKNIIIFSRNSQKLQGKISGKYQEKFYNKTNTEISQGNYSK